MAKYSGLKTLEVLEGADNYNKWIASRIKPFLVPPILEIGAGTGNISSYLSDFKDLTLTDIDKNLIKKLKSRFSNKDNIHVEEFNIETNLGRVKNKFKSIYLVNVLEHIKNEEKALRNINLLLEGSGKLVLLVPAKKFAYNNLDKTLGHYRRYEKKELEQILMKTNFKVLQLEYFNIIGLLSWMVRNKLSKNHDHLKASHVKIFDIIVPMLSFIEPKKGLPIGISLIAVGEKK